VNILFIGDIVGKPGRRTVARWLPRLRDKYAIDFVAANAENAAGGLGATPTVIDDLRDAGVQAFTMGNHTWRKKELVLEIETLDDLVRPANYRVEAPGQGSRVVELPDGRQVGLVNVQGRVYMEPCDCPFAAAKREVTLLRETASVVLVDVHAEATSEKVAMGWFLDGHCTAVMGTHTHVQTSDERVLPKGTAYITDVGMTGSFDSVLGVEREKVINKFVTGMPTQFTLAKGNPGLSAVVIKADESTGRALSITRLLETGE